MKERPILFSGPMVRQIFDDNKTHTRRVVKPQPLNVKEFPSGCGRNDGGAVNVFAKMECPYGVPGDRLWVRETFQSDDRGRVAYRASESTWPTLANGVDDGSQWINWDWRPSIFMPRWASRLLLEVKAVRVERLQEISENDAFAEGISGGDWLGDPVGTYRLLWDSINGKKAPWVSNPFVWVVEFERVEP